MRCSPFLQSAVRHLPKACVAVVISLALAGCGGGGDSGTTTAPGTTSPVVSVAPTVTPTTVTPVTTPTTPVTTTPGTTTSNPTSEDIATDYAANSAFISGDAASAVDTAILAAQAVVLVEALSAPLSTADGALPAASLEQPQAAVNKPVACPGGGTATLSISGGTVISQLNGTFDTGEVYLLAFANCKGALGAAAITGTFSLTVQSATTTTLSLAINANSVTVALPRGSVNLGGSAVEQLTTVRTGSATQQITSRLTAPRLVLTSQLNGRTSSFTLSDTDVTRQASLTLGLLQSSTSAGTHTLAASLPKGSFSYTVSSQSGVTYDANGAPTAGSWTVTLPNAQIVTTVANGLATITVDDGKDGTIDRRFTVPVGTLVSRAG